MDLPTERAEYPAFEFASAVHLPRATVRRYLWGDDDAGYTSDWIYFSNEVVSQVVFTIAPGRSFRHSEKNRAIYPADEVWYVLEGTLAIHNPARGEVHRVLPGESVFFRRDTWHYAYNFSQEPLRILEFSAPPAIEAVRYSESQPGLKDVRLGIDGAYGNWPMGKSALLQEDTIHVLRQGDVLWRIHGHTSPVLQGLLASTEHLTVLELHLLPGQLSETETHRIPETGFLLAGQIEVHMPGQNGAEWINLDQEDGYYVPPGTPHRYLNNGETPARLLLQLVGDIRDPELEP